MRAICSQRLENVLNDQKACEQLLAFFESATLAEPSSIEIITKDENGKEVRYLPRLVRVRAPSR